MVLEYSSTGMGPIGVPVYGCVYVCRYRLLPVPLKNRPTTCSLNFVQRTSTWLVPHLVNNKPVKRAPVHNSTTAQQRHNGHHAILHHDVTVPRVFFFCVSAFAQSLDAFRCCVLCAVVPERAASSANPPAIAKLVLFCARAANPLFVCLVAIIAKAVPARCCGRGTRCARECGAPLRR
jgi:hypothetical protein